MIKRLLNGNIHFVGTAQQITDWQYVAKIHKSLKQNNINEAMKYLINSYLDGVILDRQTFYNTHLKMVESKSALSYQELAYKLYRQSFSPHILMKDWMKVLLETKDEKTIQLLKKDHEFLKMQIPAILCQKPKQKTNSDAQSEKNTSEENAAPKQTHGRKKTVNYKNDKKEQIKLITSDKQKLNEGLMNRQQISNALKTVEWKITIHDLEISFENFDEETITEMAQNNINYGINMNERNFEPNQQDILDALKLARRIKIGRIQISDNKNNPLKPDQ